MRFDDDEPTDDGLIRSMQEQLEARVKEVAPNSPAARDWKRLHTIYSGTIRRSASRCGLREQEIDDLESDVWVQLLQCLPQYRKTGQPGSFRAWLYTIVRRKTIDLLRRNNRHPTGSLTSILDNHLDPIDPAGDAAEIAERCWEAELANSVLELLRAGDPDGTRMFEMHIVEDRSIAEIAAEVGKKPDHVRDRIHDVKARIRDAMQYFMGKGG